MSSFLVSNIEEIDQEILRINKEISLLKKKISTLETERIGLSLMKDSYKEKLRIIQLNEEI